ncbi:MAG TPA: preprotein translocase subunit SecG [Candidatus Paceibacterota bacterium]|nr:preprotein translocase subunit SecG [Candidatus Paceibacterota bacterium]
MNTAFKIAQLVLSVLIIILILLQERGGGVSEAFGGGGSGFYQQRRGIEKYIYIGTIVCLVLFAAVSLANLFVR